MNSIYSIVLNITFEKKNELNVMCVLTSYLFLVHFMKIIVDYTYLEARILFLPY